MLVFLATTVSLSAQTWVYDTLYMGSGLVDNEYYRMDNNGPVKTSSSTDWHIGFSLSILDSASVIANHNVGNAFVQVINPHKALSDWSMVTLADTGANDMMYNGDQFWSQGAFNQSPSANPFNYGWGTYNLSNHIIYGDSMFIVKANGNFYKFAIDSLDAITFDWYYRVEKLGGMNTTQYRTVSKSAFANRLFAYVHLDSIAAIDREPAISDWDVLFTTYSSFVPQGPPPAPMAWYGVTGALSNRGINVAKVQAVHVDSTFANYQSYLGQWATSTISTIGYDWKFFDGMGYVIADSLSYIVKSKNDSIYQLQFLNYGGSATGEIAFRKRTIGYIAVGTQDLTKTLQRVTLYPNPANQEATLLFESKHAKSAYLSLYDMQGRKVIQLQHNANVGLNAWKINTSLLSNGTYHVLLQMDDDILKEKMTIIR